MPLLADAYSDAHLNLTTLDKDITAAIKKLEVAAKKFEKILNFDVGLDTKEASTKLKRFKADVDRIRREISSNAAELKVKVDNSAASTTATRVTEAIAPTAEPDTGGIIPTPEIPAPQIGGQGSLFDEVAQVEEQLRLFDDIPPVDIPVEIDKAAADAQIVEIAYRLKQLREANASIPVDVDAATANAIIEELYAQLQILDGEVVDVTVDADDDQAQMILKAIKLELAKFQDDLVINASVDIDGLAEAISQLEFLKKEADRLEETISLNADGDTTAAKADLAALNAVIAGLDTRINLNAEADIGAAMQQLLLLKAGKEAVDGDIKINADVDTGSAVGKLGALKAATSAADGGSKGLLNTLSGLGGGAGGGGMGGIGKIAALGSAALVFGPAIPGLLGAAAGFLAVGAGAAVAVGGLAAMGVALNKLALSKLQDELAVAKAALVTTFQPLADFITDDVAPRFLGAFQGLLSAAAPLAMGLIAPITDSLVGITDVFKSVLTPELVEPFGAGIAGLIDTFGKFIPTLAGSAQAITGPLFNALNALIDLLFGTATTGTPIWVSALDGFADLARGLIGPFNYITTLLQGMFESIGPAIGGIFSEVGPILLDFIEGAIAAIGTLVNAIESAGVENLAVAFGVLAAVFGSPAIAAGIALFLYFEDIVAGLSPLIEGLAGLLGSIGGVINVVIGGAIKAISTILGAIDFSAVFTALRTQFDVLRAYFSVVSAVLQKVAQQIGNVFRGFFNTFKPEKIQALAVPIVAFFGTILSSINQFDDSGLSKTTTGWGETLGNLVNGLLDFVIAAQRAYINFMKGFIKPAMNAALDFAVVFLNALDNVLDFLAGPFSTVLLGSLYPAALAIDAITGSDLTGALDTAKGALQSAASATDEWGAKVENLRPVVNQAADDAIAWTEDMLKQQEAVANGTLTWEEFMKQQGFGARQSEVLQTETEKAREQITKLSEEYASGKIDANKYYKELGKAASTVLPATAKAFERLQELAAKGVDLEAGRKLRQQQIDDFKSLASAAEANIKSVAGSGGLSSFFKLDDADAAEVESGAKKIYDATQKWLGRGKLSDFVDKEALDLNRSLDDLVAIFELKAANIARLKTLEALGLPNLAAQLATLNADPELLRDALDELFDNGIDAYRGYEDRLGQVNADLGAQLGNLSPSLTAGLGENFAEEATDKVKEGTDNLFVALDQLKNGIRLRAANIERLKQLEAMGFGSLAAELVTLNDDPEALKNALDQLFAGGADAIRNANAGIEAEYAAVAAAVQDVGPRVAKALGLQEGAKQVEKDTVSFVDALAASAQATAIQVMALATVQNLEEKKFFNIAKLLAGVTDPELFAQYASELSGYTDEQLRFLNETIGAQQAALDGEVKARGDAIATALGVVPPQAGSQAKTEIETLSDEITTAVDQAATKISDSITTAFSGNIKIDPQVGINPDGTVSAIDGAAGTILNTLDAQKRAIEEKAKGVGGAAQKGINEGATGGGGGGGLLPIGGGLGGVVASWLAGGFDFTGVTEKGREIGGTLLGGLSGALTNPESLSPALGPVGGTIANFLSGSVTSETVAPLLGPVGGTLLNGITSNLTNPDGLSLAFGPVGGTIAGGLAGAFTPETVSAIMGPVAGVLLGPVTGQLTNTEGVNAAFGPAGSIISGALSGALGTDTVKGVLSTAGSGLVDAIRNGVGIGDALLDKFAPSAGDMVEGLKQGFDNNKDTLIDFIKQWARDSLPLGLRIALGINSPSKVTAEIGGFAADGLVLGFVSGLQSQIGAFGAAVPSLLDPIASRLAGVDSIGAIAGQSLAQSLLSATQDTLASSAAISMPNIDTSGGRGRQRRGREFYKNLAPDTILSQDVKFGDYLSRLGYYIGNDQYSATDPFGIETASLRSATSVGAPTPIAAPSATTTDTLLLQQVLGELQAQNAIVKEASVRPLIGEYNVATTKQPQSPDQLAQDAAFVKALLG